MKNKGGNSLWELYLTREISIEFKACLYFFSILFYYCVYRVVNSTFTAEILHMAEMILLCYVIGYAQVYLFGNFDEAERFRIKETAGMILCTAVYTAASFFLKWFDRKTGWTMGFAVYMIILFLSTFLVYRIKREIDDKKLNEDLALFQFRGETVRDTEKESPAGKERDAGEESPAGKERDMEEDSPAGKVRDTEEQIPTGNSV